MNLAKTESFSTTHRTLKYLALLVWLTGPIVLALKSSELLLEAQALTPASLWVGSAIPLGIMVGLIKTKFIFRKACKKNLARIDAIAVPKIWQFYRPKFFLFLVIMILAGSFLSSMAHGNFPFLIFVGILDLSLATALFLSSTVFWQEKAFRKR